MTALLLTAVTFAAGTDAWAQESPATPGRIEISIIPGGGFFFTEATDAGEPSFGNYDLGAAAALNINRYIGVEGEVSGALGVSQGLQFGGSSDDRKTPHLLNYSGNVVVSAPNRTSVVPYATAGIGALNLPLVASAFSRKRRQLSTSA